MNIDVEHILIVHLCTGHCTALPLTQNKREPKPEISGLGRRSSMDDATAAGRCEWASKANGILAGALVLNLTHTATFKH